MEKTMIQLSKQINAPKEKVWKVLLDDDTYRKWTSAFMEGSYFEGDWSQGSKVYFKAPDGCGLVSRVKEHEPNEIIVIEHLGVLQDGKEDYNSAIANEWQGFTETYSVAEKNGGTELRIEQEISEKEADSFGDMWTRALQKVKELAES